MEYGEKYKEKLNKEIKNLEIEIKSLENELIILKSCPICQNKFT